MSALAPTPCGSELARLRERCRLLEEFIALHLQLCAEKSDQRRAARDIVDAIDPRMTEEEMQAAWSMIRYHKRIEAEATMAAASLMVPPPFDARPQSAGRP